MPNRSARERLDTLASDIAARLHVEPETVAIDGANVVLTPRQASRLLALARDGNCPSCNAGPGYWMSVPCGREEECPLR